MSDIGILGRIMACLLQEFGKKMPTLKSEPELLMLKGFN